ncbi:MAG: hypothetical protein ACKVPJ_00840 [Chitinophagales bacterium]
MARIISATTVNTDTYYDFNRVYVDGYKVNIDEGEFFDATFEFPNTTDILVGLVSIPHPAPALAGWRPEIVLRNDRVKKHKRNYRFPNDDILVSVHHKQSGLWYHGSPKYVNLPSHNNEITLDFDIPALGIGIRFYMKWIHA